MQPPVLSSELSPKGDRFLQVQLYSQMKSNSWNGIKKLQLLLVSLYIKHDCFKTTTGCTVL